MTNTTGRCLILMLSLGLMILAMPRPESMGAPEAEKKTAPAAEAKFSPEDLTFFEKEVRPLLDTHCLKCHGSGDKIRGGLRLDSRSAVLKGGETGPVVALDKPETSLLLKAIHYKDTETIAGMPPKGKLSDKDIATLTRWVKTGVPMPAGSGPVGVHPPSDAGKVTPESRNYWAYRPLLHPPVPVVKNSDWVRNPIDAFILAKLEAKGITPTGPADRVALIRRVTYDLTGLPPSPEEVDAFVKDQGANAYEKLIDRLLDSPHYGEKWGRHWLDLVRYAETHGYERDSPKPQAWRYRDYVIDSFNKDKPYNTFLREQLAGDELDQVTPETITATGYYRLGIWDDEPADRALAKYDVLDGIVSTTSNVILGMSVGCARCHDHKRDPIAQKDYYRLLGVFANISDMNASNLRKISTPADNESLAQRVKEKQAREAELTQQINQMEQRFTLALAARGLVPARHNSDLLDLNYRFYRDTWDKLPDFNGLKVETQGPVPDGYFSLTPATRSEAIGLVFEGKLKVPQAGEYLFTLDSTDGARLLIDGKIVLDRPMRGKQTAEVKATLAQGLVPVRFEYFHTVGKPNLELFWSGPGVGRRSLTPPANLDTEKVLMADSRTTPQTWTFTTTKPPMGWQKPEFKATDWKQGPGGFGTDGTPGAVVKTVWQTDDIWLRRTFHVEQMLDNLVLDLHHDDDVEVYLNGTLIYRDKGFSIKYERFPLGAEAVKALKLGNNVLAVHCRQLSGGQFIDVGLVANGRPDLTALIRTHGAEVLDKEDLARYASLTNQLEAVRKQKPAEKGLEIMCVEERGRNVTRVLIRGNPGSPGDVVEPGIPEVLVADPPKFATKEGTSSGRRRALAEWLTSGATPVPARVLANRLWQYHFGRGIVPTSNDFGRLGESATHPELLDWLAEDLVQGGWKLKRMHKLLLLSNTYQMSAQVHEVGLKADPANMLFWHANPRRLTAEEVRDSILMASGKLNLKAGGPSVYPPIPKEVLAGQSVPGSGWHPSTPEESNRRSVYVHVKRSLLVPILAQHDQADTDSSCAVRYVTTVPTQALGMLNGTFTNEQAGFLADRLEKEAKDDLAAQVRRAIRLTTGREPGQEEVDKDMAFVKQQQEKDKLTPHNALRRYCLLMLNTNEFVYVD